MPEISKKEIENYVESKRGLWSDRTLPVLRSILTSLAPNFSSPLNCYKTLSQRKLSRYYIKTSFLYAIGFERERLGTEKFRNFLQENRAAFKNCYKDKQRQISRGQFDSFLNLYRDSNPAMFNLLVLMGLAGLRISEARSAKWSDIKDGFLWVIGKGNKQRKVPFDTSKLIKTNREAIVGPLAYRIYFKRDMSEFTPHDFRAFFATEVANHPELNIKDAALLLGHSHISVTARYLRSDINRIAKVLLR